MDCGHKNQEIRRKRAINGTDMVAYQCMDCGEMTSCHITHEKALLAFRTKYTKIEEIPEWDRALVEKTRQANTDRWKREAEERQAERGVQNTAWREKYEAYLLTREWFYLRDKILKRDKNICQACLIANATQVHHLSYVNMGAEFCYQLISVCSECHRKIHERNLPFE